MRRGDIASAQVAQAARSEAQESTQESALTFADLALTLRGRAILRGVSGACRAGAVTVILGANGAGKSMLLACLVGLRSADSGAVRLGSRLLADISLAERAQRIGYLPQHSPIHWNLSGRALVALGRLPYQRGIQIKGGLGAGLGAAQNLREADTAAIAEALAQVDAVHLAERSIAHMSGGERARLLLARVLAGRPDWIIADEPLTNLDPAHQLDSLACLRAVAHGESGRAEGAEGAEGAKGAEESRRIANRKRVGVVLVLHDLTQAARVADHIILMKSGAILASGSVAEVLTEANIAAAFDIASYIDRDRDGRPLIVPTART